MHVRHPAGEGRSATREGQQGWQMAAGLQAGLVRHGAPSGGDSALGTSTCEYLPVAGRSLPPEMTAYQKGP